MLRVLSDALSAVDGQRVTLMGLLDRTAEFDCVDHSLLLKQRQLEFGFVDTVLGWLTSFVTSRTQQVAFDGHMSATTSAEFGVPQGSVLGPLLFVLYTAQLSQVVAAHGLTLHQYTDDCQVYLTTSVSDAPTAASRLADCLDDIATWMSARRLRLNPTKTHVMCLGSKHQVDRITVHSVPVLSTSVNVVDTARDLGVVVDSSLTMSNQVAAVCRAAYFQLRQIRMIAAHCLLMRLRLQSRRSSHVVSITATHCYAASQTICFGVYSRCRMRRQPDL